MEKKITIICTILFASFTCFSQVRLIKDIDPRTGIYGGPSDRKISIGNTIYFYEYDGEHGIELWKSDGTTEGTVMVKDIWPGTQSGNGNYEWNVFNNELYFSARDEINGTELWKTDGTLDGTALVKDINPGDKDSEISNLTVYKNKLYFFAYTSNYNYLFETDGTTNGTKKIKKFHGRGDYHLTVFKEMMYFTGDDANDFKDQGELWRSDGTAAGTITVRVNGSGYAFGPSNFFVAGDVMYFVASDVNDSRELWKTGGTDAGTTLVKDINTREHYSDSYPENFIQYKDEVYFTAIDGIHGHELWKTDGTEKGTVLLKDLNPGQGAGISGMPVIYKDQLFFSANDGEKHNAIWKINGTDGAIVLVNNNSGMELTVFNDKIYFSGYVHGDTNYDSELWVTDGTSSGTELVADIYAGRRGSNPQNFNVVGNSLFFKAYTAKTGPELYVYKDAGLSIDEETLDNSIAIFPNPFKNKLNISTKLNEIVKIELYNILGSKIKTVTKNFDAISTSNFKSGVYVIKIYTENQSFSKKIIKM
jgi:ELWxxDGT repeat protein